MFWKLKIFFTFSEDFFQLWHSRRQKRFCILNNLFHRNSVLEKSLKGGQAKEDEVDDGEGEKETSFGEVDYVCHPVFYVALTKATGCLRMGCWWYVEKSVTKYISVFYTRDVRTKLQKNAASAPSAKKQKFSAPNT